MNENTGWICPRCNTVHAPTVLTCNCPAQGQTIYVPWTPYPWQTNPWTYSPYVTSGYATNGSTQDSPEQSRTINPWNQDVPYSITTSTTFFFDESGDEEEQDSTN